MKVMQCPLNGRRNLSEFVYGGEVQEMPPAGADDAAWADYLFYRDNAAGVVREWWCHLATSYWFVAERSTVTDEIVRTYPPEELAAAASTPPASPSSGGDDSGGGGAA